MLYRITSRYFVCGIVIDDNYVVRVAAPIMKWAIGKRIEDVLHWCYSKHMHVAIIA